MKTEDVGIQTATPIHETELVAGLALSIQIRTGVDQFSGEPEVGVWINSQGTSGQPDLYLRSLNPWELLFAVGEVLEKRFSTRKVKRGV